MRIDGSTKVAGVIGYPIGHSLSPLMHNTAFRELGLDFVYVPFPVHPQDLAQAIRGMRALGIVGLNVTVPHKVAVMEYCDELTEDAQRIGAVNTIINRDGVLIGDNTDARGFVTSLGSPAYITGQEVLLLGAGGAARAIAFGLLQHKPKRLTIANRSKERGIQLVKSLAPFGPVESVELGDELFIQRLASSGLIIHATSCGMYPACDESIITDATLLPKDALVCDIVYNPLKTKLLALAEAAGCQILDGLGMLVHQGAIAFEAWTGRPAPVAHMEEVLRAHLISRTAGEVSKESKAEE